MIGSILSGIGNLVGSIGQVANGPRKQYKYNVKLAEKQAELNEIAAQNDQVRALEMFDHQFASQQENQQAMNAYNSASAQRARNEIAGISKAALTGGSSATPAAALGGASSSGAGTTAGTHVSPVDVIGYGDAFSRSMQGLGDAAAQLGLIESQKDLNKAYARQADSQVVTNNAESVYKEALTGLAQVQSLSEGFRKDILAVESRIAEATEDNQVTMSDYSVDRMFQDIQLLKKANQREEESNRIYRAHGEREVVARIRQMEAAAVLSYVQSQGVLAQIGLTNEQARLVAQLAQNAVHDGTLKEWIAKFTPIKDKFDAAVTAYNINFRDRQFQLQLDQFQRHLVSQGIEDTSNAVRVFAGILGLAQLFVGTPAINGNTNKYGNAKTFEGFEGFGFEDYGPFGKHKHSDGTGSRF